MTKEQLENLKEGDEVHYDGRIILVLDLPLSRNGLWFNDVDATGSPRLLLSEAILLSGQAKVV
jgi:tartrate dehydratase beta subunit/fumarate hydratase class I family protein